MFEAGNGSDTIADFTGSSAGLAERDQLRFVGYGEDAYLSNDGDDWTIHYSGGQDSFHLAGVTTLTPADYDFV